MNKYVATVLAASLAVAATSAFAQSAPAAAPAAPAAGSAGFAALLPPYGFCRYASRTGISNAVIPGLAAGQNPESILG